MVRVRNLVLAIAAATALTSGMAHALGLGEVNLQSSLNQPLVAEIELMDARGFAPGEIVPALASVEEFNKAGIDRQYFLTDLKFTPVQRSDGRQVIRVTSSKPIREPYLNFLVELLWPNGRLLREYTLLLDPPLYSPEVVAQAAPQLPIAAPLPKPVVSAPVMPARTQVPAPTVPAPVGNAQGEYRTTSRDTLWQIAERVSGGRGVHQTMLAIQDLNPDAFIGGNINVIKSGQVLRMPTAEQIASRSEAEAISEVARQNAAWRQGRAVAGGAARQLDATPRATNDTAPAHSAASDSLRLVAGQAGDATVGGERGAEGETKALLDQLAVSKENLDSSRRENGELKERLTDLQGQLDKLQRLIALKDDQLAKLQTQLAAEPKADPATQTATAEPAPVVQPAPAPMEDTVKPAAPAEAGVHNSSEKVPEPAVAPPVSTPVVPPMTEQAPVPATEKPVAAPPKAAVAPAKPIKAVPVEQEQDDGFLAEMLGNPMLLAGLGGTALLVLLLGLMAKSRRNAMKEADTQEAAVTSELSPEVPDPFGTSLAADDDTALPVDEESVSKSRLAAETAAPAKATDTLAEADIYIAYGRFSQAAELLQNALNLEPQRRDLRLKLMEVRAEMNDRDGFAKEEAELREIGGAEADIDRLKSKYPAMAAATLAAVGGLAAGAAAASEFDDLRIDDLLFDENAEPAKPQQEEPLFDEDFDLSLDDLEAQLTLDKPTDQTQTSSEEPFLLSGDFEPSLDLDAASQKPAEEDDSLSFMLDDEPALGESETPVAAAKADDEFDFDFDLDALEDDVSTMAPVVTEESKELAFEGFDLADDEREQEQEPSLAEPESEPMLGGIEDVLDLPADEVLQGSTSEEVMVPAGMNEPVEEMPAEVALDESILPVNELTDTAATEAEEIPAAFELPDEFDLDLEGDLDSSSFAAQLDEMDAELDALAKQFDEPLQASPEPSVSPELDLEESFASVADTLQEPSEAPTETSVGDFDAFGEDLGFLSDMDETSTKLDLAKAYIEMGDAEGARDILDEVLNEGSTSQQQEARDMLARLA